MYIILSALAAFTITFILLPIIIKVSRSVDLLDIPDRRKIHSISTPSLGGIAIFIGFMLTVIMTIPFDQLADIKFLLYGLVLIFMLGVRDDVSSLMAKNKLFVQIFAAGMIVYFADIQLTGFYGIFGIEELPDWFNIPFSMFVIVGLTNSFNLIDGIDGLAGSAGVLILSFLGWTFISMDELAYAVVCISAVGALLAFLFYNWHPSKIFMGDTGSLALGFIISSLTIEFINLSAGLSMGGIVDVHSTVGIAIALLILPVFDTARVFTIRFMNGKNPLDPDRNHLHHGLLKLGMNHAQATTTLVSFNLILLVIALVLNGFLGNGFLTFIVFSITLMATAYFELRLSKKKYMGKSKKVSSARDLYISKSA